jgi:hypothetical protein
MARWGAALALKCETMRHWVDILYGVITRLDWVIQ